MSRLRRKNYEQMIEWQEAFASRSHELTLKIVDRSQSDAEEVSIIGIQFDANGVFVPINFYLTDNGERKQMAMNVFIPTACLFNGDKWEEVYDVEIEKIQKQLKTNETEETVHTERPASATLS